jgi:hypothetical protein
MAGRQAPAADSRAGIEMAQIKPTLMPPLIAGTVFIFIIFVPRILHDDDTIWHILTGNGILQHWAVPQTDPYSYTKFGERWFAHEWLSEVFMALADRVAGLRGVMFLAALAMGLTAGLLLHHLRRFMAPFAAVIVVILGMACTSPSMLARPHVLAWPVLELWCAGLVIARANKTAPRWWLLPLMALWVNLHGGFIIGLAQSAALGVEAAFEAGAAWYRPALKWGLFTVAAVAATLLNPNGLSGLLFPFQLLQMHELDFIDEWRPTNFAKFQPLELVLLFCVALGLLGRLKVPQFRLLLFLGLIHEALTHVRHNQMLGIVGSLLLAESIGWMAPIADRAKTATASRFVTWQMRGLAACVVVAVVVRLALPLAEQRADYGLNATLEKLPPALRMAPVLNEYAFGARLIGAGIRPFVDSRADLYGDAFLERYFAIINLQKDALPETLANFHIAWTIFSPEAPINLWLDHQPGWHRLLSDSIAVVYARDEALPVHAAEATKRTPVIQ